MGRKKRRQAKRETKEAKLSVGKEHAINTVRVEAAARRKKRVLITWGFVIASLLMIALLVYAMWPKPSPYNEFAQCLAESGTVMYGTDWCNYCQAQKRLFGSAFVYVGYENCDSSRICQEKGITGYPTWVFPDESRLSGAQPLEVLAEKSGCVLPEES